MLFIICKPQYDFFTLKNLSNVFCVLIHWGAQRPALWVRNDFFFFEILIQQGSRIWSENYIYSSPLPEIKFSFSPPATCFPILSCPFCVFSSLFCIYFTLLFPIFSCSLPFLPFSPSFLFLLNFPPFLLRFSFFPKWHRLISSSPGGGGEGIFQYTDTSGFSI